MVYLHVPVLQGISDGEQEVSMPIGHLIRLEDQQIPALTSEARWSPVIENLA